MTPAIQYSIRPAHPGAHLFQVNCQIPAAKPTHSPRQITLQLPAWIPGSYMIREFARNIVTIHARTAAGKPVALHKTDKHTWVSAPYTGELHVEYQVYAWDLSVRAAHLDTTHAFFNGSSVFLSVLGHTHLPHRVQLIAPEGAHYRAWRVATTLPARHIDAHGFGEYEASDYATLIDHPVEMAELTFSKFTAGAIGYEVAHEIAIQGVHDADMERLTRDVQRICQAHIELFEPQHKRPPFQKYLFMLTVVGDGYGGLEHRDSTALIAARTDLPYVGMKGTPSAYRTLLGLFSHEYFHAWHVKRILPRAFQPYDLQQETYTRLLWVFEGFTSYYDDLALLRSDLISEKEYFELLAKTITSVLRGSGRLKQSVAESSFDAWIKYYRQDENAPNAIVSYYTKGALVALALDLLIRQRTHQQKSLDDVMRYLWQYHGKPEHGLAEDVMPTLIEEATGVNVRTELQRWVTGTEDLPLDTLLASQGVQLTSQTDNSWPLGMKLGKDSAGAKVLQVLDDSPAQHAGIAAGDTLISLNHLRATAENFAALLERQAPQRKLTLHVWRHEVLQVFHVTHQPVQTLVWKMSRAHS